MDSWKEYLTNTFATLQYGFIDLVVANLLWALCSLLVITIPPAFAGLYYATNQLAHDRKSGWRTFFIGFRRYFWPSWRWFLINIGLLGILIFNILYGSVLLAPGRDLLPSLYWALLFVWLLLQLYSFPLLIEQEEPRLLLALRNSFILWIAHLPFNLILTAVVLLVVVGSVYLWPAWFVLSAALVAFLANSGLVRITIDHRGEE